MFKDTPLEDGYKNFTLEEFKEQLESLEVRDENKKLVTILKQLIIEEEKVYKKLSRTKDEKKGFGLAWEIGGLRKAAGLIAQELNFDELLEAHKL